MNLNLSILLTLFLVAISCSQDSKKKIIPRDDFTDILVDVHLMDGLTSFTEFRNEMAKKDSVEYLEAVLEHHGYTKAQYDSSLVYYSKDLKKFDQIYQDVIERLNKLETQTDEMIKKKREEKEEYDTTS
ncbi:MAG: DUF4296 domain-containing protein [Bacteroidales bacterium]